VEADVAMTAPWIEDSTGASLVTAVAIGVAFGAALERAGLGSARKLVGQFHGTDLTVLKVMFSAIVVAMLGAFWLGWLGVVDLSRVAVPETFWVPQLVGGAVFGAGMATAGLCPGTSCVAAASGRGDGLAVLLGMFSGVLVTGLAFAPLRGLYESGGRGALTVPAWLGLPYGAVVLAVVAIALAAFRVADRIARAS
jgi:uncharacterized membrane protein YedE/YeeE